MESTKKPLSNQHTSSDKTSKKPVAFPKMKLVEIHRHEVETCHQSELPDLNAISAVKDRTEQMTVSQVTAHDSISHKETSKHDSKCSKTQPKKEKHTRRKILIGIMVTICVIGVAVGLYFTATAFDPPTESGSTVSSG